MQNHQTDAVMLGRLADIDVIALDAAMATGLPGQRARRLLQNRQRVAPDRLPFVILATHNGIEQDIAARHADGFRRFCNELVIVDEQSRNEMATHALSLHQRHFPGMSEPERLARILLLGRRGGSGKPHFIAPFTGGEGTTCGTWTPIVAYRRGNTTWIAGTRPVKEEREATPIRGFLRGNYAQGVCPAACSFCYLRGLRGMGIKQILLNLEDAIPEVEALPQGSVVNWAELGGPVEQDPWFVDEQGQGSLVQTVLDLSTERGVVAFFLTKGKYEPYLQLQDRLALLAISLNAPGISDVFEPGGAPAEERLKGLAWAIDHGAMDHTIRLGPLIPIEGYERHYHQLFTMMRDILGTRLKRVTVDLLRFSPQMPAILKASFPEPVVSALLGEMASEVKAHKLRSSRERQLQLYLWVREMLAQYDMSGVVTTPCKADPTEGKNFLQAGALTSMPCACHIAYRDRASIQQGKFPGVSGKAIPLMQKG